MKREGAGRESNEPVLLLNTEQQQALDAARIMMREFLDQEKSVEELLEALKSKESPVRLISEKSKRTGSKFIKR